MEHQKRYIKVILPLKIDEPATYSLPENVSRDCIGCRVEVLFGRKVYAGVVDSLLEEPDIPQEKIREIAAIDFSFRFSVQEIGLWHSVADYYMCTVGEVFKAAFPSGIKLKGVPESQDGDDLPQEELTASDSGDEYGAAACFSAPELSPAQAEAKRKIQESFAAGKPVLLRGVTGSGKTEIYISLAIDALAAGKSVFYMVPEVAISRQLKNRLEEVFADRLMIYHSKVTPAAKRKVYENIVYGKKPSVVLGLRSAVFLPFRNLGLIVVDEEHDASYKQDDPAPRYNGRDVAVMMSSLYGAGIVLGSATPSLESLYNVRSGKYNLSELTEKYFGAMEPEVEVVDTIRAMKRKEMTLSFSRHLLDRIRECTENGEQAVIFRNRRAYSPLVQCVNCGYVPKCPHCNIHLTYHKFNNTLSCHYCGATYRFNTICPECARPALRDKGTGTEKLEEELSMIMPQLRVARYDADVTKSTKEDRKVLKAFAKGETDVLIGTQMISKGFDFRNVTLTAIINADSMIAREDFRADERAMQLISQLKGRSGRRQKRGRLVIQTAMPHSNVFRDAVQEKDSRYWSDMAALMSERKQYGFPPYTRAICIEMKDRNPDRLDSFSRKLAAKLAEAGVVSMNGPFAPPVDMIAGQKICDIWIWLQRDRNLVSVKRRIFKAVWTLAREEKFYGGITIDVDPY